MDCVVYSEIQMLDIDICELKETRRKLIDIPVSVTDIRTYNKSQAERNIRVRKIKT